MALPHALTYNDLDGEEVKSILLTRFRDLLSQVPYLQRHITLPRLRMTLSVRLETHADQPTPELLEIADDLTLTATVSSAPIPGGNPPDKVRDDHGIHIPSQVRAQNLPFHHDVLAGREVEGPGGIRIDRTGTGGLSDSGIAKLRSATVVTQDLGPAGIRQGGERERLGFKNMGSDLRKR